MSNIVLLCNFSRVLFYILLILYSAFEQMLMCDKRYINLVHSNNSYGNTNTRIVFLSIYFYWQLI